MVATLKLIRAHLVRGLECSELLESGVIFGELSDVPGKNFLIRRTVAVLVIRLLSSHHMATLFQIQDCRHKAKETYVVSFFRPFV